MRGVVMSPVNANLPAGCAIVDETQPMSSNKEQSATVKPVFISASANICLKPQIVTCSRCLVDQPHPACSGGYGYSGVAEQNGPEQDEQK
jgi:hypothetical protein